MPCAGASLLAIVLSAFACRPAPASPAAKPSAAPVAHEPAATPAVCGDEHTRVAATSLPSAPLLLARIELADPERDAALDRLSSYARGDGHDLPLPVAFAMAQWSWEVAVVRDTFARLGFVAGELIVARFDHGSAIWSLPLGCAMTEALDHLRRAQAWRIDDAGDAILAAPPASASIPFEVVVADGLITLAPAGQGRTALAAMRRDPPMSELSMPERLAELEAAPIRVIVRGTALLGGGATAGALAPVRGLRVGATALASVSLSSP